MNTVEDFVAWLGETHRSVSHAASMAVGFHPSDTDEAAKLVEAYRAARQEQGK